MFGSDEKEYLLNILHSTPRLVENKLIKNNRPLNHRQDYFYLKDAIDIFLNEDTDNRFFIMPGIRGVGKTTILYQLFDYLHNQKDIPQTQILYLDLDRLKDFGNINLQKYLDIFIRDINERNFLNNNPLFIFVDESQYVNNWALVGKIIFDETKNVFLIFTGSDALNLESNNDAARRAIKKQIYPLSFSEYLYLKYDSPIPKDLEEKFIDMIFTGNISEAREIEKDLKLNVFMNIKRDIQKEWEDYIQYGGLPFSFNREDNEIIQLTIDMKNRIIEKDLDLFGSFTSSTRLNAYQLLNIIALQKPSEISLNKLANILEISKKTVDNLLSTLEETQIIFHIDSYGPIVKRTRRPAEYYFLSTQVKSCIYQSNGQATRNKNEYLGFLVENLVASTLFKVKNKFRNDFGIFYDPENEGVDFLINTLSGDVIPVEVGIGQKNKRQISGAIKKYKSDYGFVISSTKSEITKDGNVIFIPLITFSLL